MHRTRAVLSDDGSDDGSGDGSGDGPAMPQPSKAAQWASCRILGGACVMETSERMNQVARHSICRSTLLQKIDASMLALDAVRAVLYGGDAGRINHVMTLSQETFEAVQQHVETSPPYKTRSACSPIR